MVTSLRNLWGAIDTTKIPTGPTGKSGPPQKVDPFFSKLFRLDRTDPLSFGPKFPEVLVECIAPVVLLKTSVGGWVLPGLLGMCRWMGSHFHDCIDYNGRRIFNGVTRMVSHIFGFYGARRFFIFTDSKRTRTFVL